MPWMPSPCRLPRNDVCRKSLSGSGRYQFLRFRKWQGRILGILFLLFIPGGFLLSLGPEWLQKIPLISGLAWLLGTLFISIFQRRLRCSGRVGDHFIVKGFHPAALKALQARLESTPQGGS